MKKEAILTSNSFSKNFSWIPEPALAWTAIFSLIVVTLLGTFAGVAKALSFAFPVGALGVGLLLYFRYPVMYLSFTWWIWFLTAFVRRLADYESGFYTEPSPMLMAPYLVTGITLITVVDNLAKSGSKGSFPFILSFLATIYGSLVGFIYKPFTSVVIGSLDWLVPISLGFHLYVNWRNYPAYRRNLQRTFLWGVLLMGTYGIFQYVMTPQWDISWIDNADMITANGYPGQTPGRFAIRLFSTMQSIEPFGNTMGVGLLMLFSYQGILKLPAAVVGYLSFLLTLMRSAWLGWLAGLITLVSTMKSKFQIRLLVSIIVMVICILPLTTIEPFSQVIDSRIQSLTNVQEDKSATGRVEYFQDSIVTAVTTVAGNGIQNGNQDSTILALLLYLGWIGTIPYLGGLFMLVLRLFQNSESDFDPFISTARAVAISILVRFPVNGVIMESSGVALWSFLALGLAAKKYAWQQRRSMAIAEGKKVDCS